VVKRVVQINMVYCLPAQKDAKEEKLLSPKVMEMNAILPT